MSGIISDNQGRSSGLVKSAASSDYVKLNTTTVSSTIASVSIDGYFTSDYDYYNLYFTNVRPAADAQLDLRFNSGGSAITGGNYRDSNFSNTNSGSSYQLDGEKYGHWGTTYFALSVAGNNNATAAYGGVCGEVQIFQPLNAAVYPQFRSSCYGAGGSGTAQQHFSGGYYDAATAISGVTLYFASQDTESGTFTLFGVKK